MSECRDVVAVITSVLVAAAIFAAPSPPARAESDTGSAAMPLGGGHTESTMAQASEPPRGAGAGKVLYYRNPVGLPDVSATPKRDLMGLDYLPVYEGEESAEPASIPLVPGGIQPPGVLPSQAPILVEHAQSQTMESSSIASPPTTKPVAMEPPAGDGRKVLYYRNPMGLPDVSPKPKRDSMGMEYLPVYQGEASADATSVPLTGRISPASVLPGAVHSQAAAQVQDGHPPSMVVSASVAAPMNEQPKRNSAAMAPLAANNRKVLYYRNPMGLPDISPTPKKDSMGMDYVPVFESERSSDPDSLQLSPGRIQRSGVRTQAVEMRVIVTPVHGFGTFAYDESAIQSVSVGIEGTIDELFIHHVGEKVLVGQPLFRIWSNQPQLLQIEMARRAHGNADQDTGVQTALMGTQRVLNRSDWPSPATGVIIAKRVIAGQHVTSTDELLRIADPSRMWVIVDIAERDLWRIEPGQKADVVVQTGSAEPLEGTVQFIYPEIKPETRTARLCVSIENPSERLKAGMYAGVSIRVGANKDPVVAVPQSAIIDDGERRHVLIDQGDGHFAPRTVVTGAEGQGYTELRSGVTEGELVVTSANFLIDSEANIDAALQAFAAAARK